MKSKVAEVADTDWEASERRRLVSVEEISWIFEGGTGEREIQPVCSAPRLNMSTPAE